MFSFTRRRKERQAQALELEAHWELERRSGPGRTPEARELDPIIARFREALTLRERLGDDQRTLTALSGLSISLTLKLDPEALVLSKRLLKIVERNPTGEDWLRAVRNAIVIANRFDDLRTLRGLLSMLLASGRSETEAADLKLLALTERLLGAHEDSEAHLGRLFELLDEARAPKAELADARKIFGALLHDSRQDHRAVSEYEAALALLAPERPPELLSSYSVSVRALGDETQADALLEEALRADPASFVVLLHLGERDQRRGALGTAAAAYRKALEAIERDLYARSPLLLRPMLGLAECLHEDDPSEARELFRRSLEIANECLDVDHALGVRARRRC